MSEPTRPQPEPPVTIGPLTIEGPLEDDRFTLTHRYGFGAHVVLTRDEVERLVMKLQQRLLRTRSWQSQPTTEGDTP